MANGIDKKALFKLKSEPYLKPISDLGVGFYNLDENTAILQFQVSNSKGPLLIHDNNLTAYAYFESSNGSASNVLDLDIIDSNNGIVQLTIDKDFLQASTSTKVTGQLYISVNNVDGKPEYNEVAVLREFTFEVKDALINKISATTKIEYIRMFDRLKVEIEKRIYDIEQAIANGEDYVAEMKTVLQQGKDALNKLVADGTKEVNDTVTQAKSDVETSKTNAVNTMTQAKDTMLQAIEDEEIVDVTQLDSTLNELQWQKHKLTENDGTYKEVSIQNDLEKYRALPAGFYYTTTTPITGVSSTAGFTVVEKRSNSVTHIRFRPYNSEQEYLMKYYETWGDWEDITPGIKSKVLFDGSTNGVDKSIGLTDSIYNYKALVISGDFPGGRFNQIVLTSTIGDYFFFREVNLSDSDGHFLGYYEARIDIVNGTTLKIANDVSWDEKNAIGSGPGRNSYTVLHIEGWK